MAVDQDIIFDVDIRELNTAPLMTLTDTPNPQNDAVAVVEACLNDSWFASLSLQVSKPKYLLFKRSVGAVDGPQTHMFIPGPTGTVPRKVRVYKERQRAIMTELRHGGKHCAAALAQLCTPKKGVAGKRGKSILPKTTRSTAKKKRKPQWSANRSSRPQQIHREATAGAPILSQYKRTRTESDASDREAVLVLMQAGYRVDVVLCLWTAVAVWLGYNGRFVVHR